MACNCRRFGSLRRAAIQEFEIPADYQGEGFNIRGLAQEDPATLLIQPTSSRLVRLREGRFSVHPVSSLIPLNQLAEFFVEPKGAVWVSTLSGRLLRWENGNAQWFGREHGLAPRSLRFTFAVDENGHTWVAVGTSLLQYQHGRLLPAGFSVREPMVITGNAQGKIWICTETRILELENGRVKVAFSDPPWKGALSSLRGYFADREGRLWLACGRNGLFCWDQNVLCSIHTPYPIVLSVAKDRENNLWVTTAGNGLGQLREKIYQLFNAGAGLTEDVSNAVLSDAAGSVWLANNSGGLVRIDSSEAAPRKPAVDLPPIDINTVSFDLEGNIWCGGREGLYCIASTGPEKLPAPKRNLHLLHRARNGDMWFAATYGMFGYYRDGVCRLLTKQDGYAGQTIRAIAEDRHGNIWAGTFSGELLVIRDEHVTTSSLRNDLNGPPIHDFLPDKTLDAMWIATARGLLFHHEGRVHVFTKTEGLADDLIGHILEDDHERIWFSTRSGIYHVARAELLAVARGEKAKVISHRVGKEQGLTGISPRYNYHPATLKSPDGRLWFTTAQGVVTLKPQKPSADQPAIPLFVDEIRLNENSVDLNRPIVISPGENRIEFHVAALSYISPEDILLKHRLEGADPAWVESPPTRILSYSGLAPGTYRLRVAAADNNGGWNEAPISVPFRVLPAWWQNPWIQLVAVIGLSVALVWLSHAWTRRRLKERVAKLEQAHALEKERSRIARDLHDELGGSLTEASFLIERLRKIPGAEIAEGLTWLSMHVRQIGAELARIVWTVSPAAKSLEELAAFLRGHAQRFFKHSPTRCTIKDKTLIPDLPVPPEVQHNLLTATKEILNNVSKHSKATDVLIEIAYSKNTFQLSVEDNGVGFINDEKLVSQGNGLANLRNRALEIGATLDIVSVPGKGTSVTLLYPVHRPNQIAP